MIRLRLQAASGNRRPGFVLIVILVIVMLLSLAAYGFLVSMQTENLAARSSGDQLVAQQHACSGIEWISALLELPAAQRQELSVGDVRELFVVPLGEESSPGTKRNQAQCLIVQPLSPEPQELAELPFGMVDESSKLHLMTLLEWEKTQPGAGRNALQRLPGMTGADADAILDWIDADSLPRAEGAEADVYAALPVPYQPRNGKPLDLEELQLIRGIDAFRLLGKSEPERPAPRGGRPGGFRTDEQPVPWSQLLTVTSAERNAARDGSPRIFVNAPQLDRLHQRLAARLPVDWANFIILYRQFVPGAATKQTVEAGQITPQFSQPPKRNIDSLLDLVNATLVMPHNGMSVTVNSPFKNDPATMKTQLPVLLDLLSVRPEERIEGRININGAPRDVLLAIPGIDEGLAERILGARSMDRTNTAGRNHAAWLLTEGFVDLPAMRKLLPSITAGGDVFRAEFWGVQDEGTPIFRCEAVIDASRRPARTLNFRDLVPWPRAQVHPLIFEPR